MSRVPFKPIIEQNISERKKLKSNSENELKNLNSQKQVVKVVSKAAINYDK